MPNSQLPKRLDITLPSGVSWPCTLRVSSRAKGCRLRVDAHGFTELVLPAKRRSDAAAAYELLQSMRPWLVKTLDRLFSAERQWELAQSLDKQSLGQTCADVLPQSVSLPLLGALWQVYVRPGTGRLRLREHILLSGTHEGRGEQGHLVLEGHVDDVPACCRILQRWVKKKAQGCLEARLRLLAAPMGAHVRQVRVRSQKGRWGSCSSRADISLNCRLLLLPEHLVDHVLLHELCHLRHMDHSLQYRQYLARFAPRWKENEKSLLNAWKCLPKWIILS